LELGGRAQGRRRRHIHRAARSRRRLRATSGSERRWERAPVGET
jgi:hypothetical protein